MGKNIKQYDSRLSPALTDFLYLVAGETDYNVTLDAIKNLFNIEDIEDWQTETFTSGSTDYTNLEDGTIYASLQIEYVIKRTGRGYRTGLLTLLVDDSNVNGVSVSDFWDATRTDGDDLGCVFSGFLSGGTIQLKSVVDASDANSVIFNYKIISKRPITVSE